MQLFIWKQVSRKQNLQASPLEKLYRKIDPINWAQIRAGSNNVIRHYQRSLQALYQLFVQAPTILLRQLRKHSAITIPIKTDEKFVFWLQRRSVGLVHRPIMVLGCRQRNSG